MARGVVDLVNAMRAIRDAYDLNSVAVSQWLPDGHLLTVRLTGQVLSIERDDGVLVTVPNGDIGEADE